PSPASLGHAYTLSRPRNTPFLVPCPSPALAESHARRILKHPRSLRLVQLKFSTSVPSSPSHSHSHTTPLTVHYDMSIVNLCYLPEMTCARLWTVFLPLVFDTIFMDSRSRGVCITFPSLGDSLQLFVPLVICVPRALSTPLPDPRLSLVSDTVCTVSCFVDIQSCGECSLANPHTSANDSAVRPPSSSAGKVDASEHDFHYPSAPQGKQIDSSSAADETPSMSVIHVRNRSTQPTRSLHPQELIGPHQRRLHKCRAMPDSPPRIKVSH
ncbi:hypothetical protein Hypma_011288, partial [Hypsizygus marmoreus]